MAGELAAMRPAAPSISRVRVRTADGFSDVELAISYTMAGPLHLEIIQAVPGTLWERLGIHHYGWFSDDLIADSAALTGRGLPLVATRDSEGGQPWQFVYHDCPPFGTIELVDVRMRPFLTDWWTLGALRRGYSARLSASGRRAAGGGRRA
jgi:hypothetical protein